MATESNRPPLFTRINGGSGISREMLEEALSPVQPRQNDPTDYVSNPPHINPINNSSLPQIPLKPRPKESDAPSPANERPDVDNLKPGIDIDSIRDDISPPAFPNNPLRNKPRSFNV